MAFVVIVSTTAALTFSPSIMLSLPRFALIAPLLLGLLAGPVAQANVPRATVAQKNKTAQPLWDGKSFAGWKTIGRGDWKIEDGAIHGTLSKSIKEYGHLVTEETFHDFVLTLKFKAVKGNSGVYFRIDETGASGVSGFQAEVDASIDVGGLYETNGRAWVSKPTIEQVASWYRPGEWNDMTVTARGGHIVVEVNGHKSAELHDDPGRRAGKIALQLHGGMDMDVWFKDLNIQRL